MRHQFIFTLCFLLSLSVFGQSNDSWIRFYDTTSDLSGYKDLNGKIKIPAKFTNFTRADTFYNIIAVTEKIDSTWKRYYLLKDGRKVGVDSVYFFDFAFDCENEGTILFEDKKKNRVGFFDKNGVVIIPAIYNAATSFRNGLAIALKNATRTCWGENEDTLNCEHLSWKGGETILINEKNEVLVDSLDINLRNINWYSLKINDPTVDTSIWITLKGVNRKTYSFINYDNEFRKWFNSVFLQAVSTKENNRFKDLLFSKITYWTKENGRINTSNDDFIKKYSSSITKERFKKNKLKEVSISDDDLIYFDKEDTLFNFFMDACGSHNRDKFPAFDVMLTYYKKRLKKLNMPNNKKSEKSELSDFYDNYEIAYQEHFEFIRTDKGYNLLKVSLKN